MSGNINTSYKNNHNDFDSLVAQYSTSSKRNVL